MPAPSSLSIATSALNRLVKEEASYHRELEQQQATIAKLEQDDSADKDENAEYQLRQERKALSETQAIFPSLRRKIDEAQSKLEAQLEKQSRDGEGQAEDVAKAKEAIAAARNAKA